MVEIRGRGSTEAPELTEDRQAWLTDALENWFGESPFESEDEARRCYEANVGQLHREADQYGAPRCYPDDGTIRVYPAAAQRFQDDVRLDLMPVVGHMDDVPGPSASGR